MEYKNYEFCKDICCPYLADECTIGNCVHTAKGFHKWLTKNGYSIVKIEDTNNENDKG